MVKALVTECYVLCLFESEHKHISICSVSSAEMNVKETQKCGLKEQIIVGLYLEFSIFGNFLAVSGVLCQQRRASKAARSLKGDVGGRRNKRNGSDTFKSNSNRTWP